MFPFFNCSLVDNYAGGLLLSILATTSSILDHYLRRINAGIAIGFTSVLIIVRTILTVICFKYIAYILAWCVHRPEIWWFCCPSFFSCFGYH